MNKLIRTSLVVFSLALQGCTGLGYYAQSANGHLKLLTARQSVEKLATDPKQPDELRAQMATARDIRQFAVDELGLPDNKSYKSYVDVGRDFVTVAVFAAPEFSLIPEVACFPVFGCVPYKAHFSINAARKERDALAAQGFDTHVTGVTAYSTLGWSADPLLNTMFRADNDSHLPAVVFHELAHQQVYIPNDSAFNEAFAVAVERTGVEKWFAAQGNTKALRDYAMSEQRNNDFRDLLDATRAHLNEVYQGEGDEVQKRAAKQAAFDRLRADYQTLRNGKWNGYAGYDGWFEGEINNAKIGATAVYSDLVPDFLKLFDACDGNYPGFYAAVEALGKVEKADRLDALRVGACG